MPEKIDSDVKASLFLVLQAAIGLITTVSLGLQGWVLLTLHQMSIDQAEGRAVATEHSRRLDAQSLAIKDNRTDIVILKVEVESLKSKRQGSLKTGMHVVSGEGV